MAILFVLPAALLRRIRKTKKGSVCDDFDFWWNKNNPDASNLEKIKGCLDLKDQCRLIVLPNPSNPKTKYEDDNHHVFCSPISITSKAPFPDLARNYENAY